MIKKQPTGFSIGRMGLPLSVLTLSTLLLNSCLDTGTSPWAPHIQYKSPSIVGKKDSLIVQNELISDSGAVTSSYTISPTLPAGLIINPTTGLISGIPTVIDTSGNYYTVTGTGPNGIAKASVFIIIGDSAHVIKLTPPYLYYDQNYLWTNPGVAITADTAHVTGRVSSYSISPELPAGITFNTSNGLISGTPTARSAAREFKVVVTSPFPVNRPESVSVYIGVFDPAYPIALLEKGKTRFSGVCSGCHGQDAKGTEGATPPLYHSDFIMSNRLRPIRIQMLGLSPPSHFDSADGVGDFIVVSGDTFRSSMPSMGGNDSEIAAVTTFIRAILNGTSEGSTDPINGLANGAMDFISVAEVAKVRDSLVALCNSKPELNCAPDATH